MGNNKKEPQKEIKKERSVTIAHDIDHKDMEEGRHSERSYMPNLPKPLTYEEKKYLLAVERGDTSTVRKILQKAIRHPHMTNINCVDPLGRGALHMAIDNENLEMVELLVVMGVTTGDALLHAIDQEFVEAVEVLLEHEEIIHKDGESYSWEKVDHQIGSFTPEITPLILAAHRDSYEILKILLDRGAMLPMPHDIRCGCPECIRTSTCDSLRHSMSRINSYKALASPSLIALSSTDPILTAFELSWELKNLAYAEHEFRAEYLELREQCRNFANELLGHTRSSSELAVILNHDPDSPPYEDGEHMKLQRLELAIDYKQKKFVAHPNVQQLLAAIWYEGLPGFRRKTLFEKLAEIVKVAILFPFYCAYYMIFPESDIGKYMRTPFMKFLIHSSSYLFFLLLLILVSVRFEQLVIYTLGTEAMIRKMQQDLLQQRGNLPTPIECAVVFYVIGFIWEEISEFRHDGARKYFRNMWNIMDVLRDSLYAITIFLRVAAFVQQSIEISHDPQIAFIPREEWNAFDPQLISEGLFAAANILSALKLVHIFSINPYLGPLQISLGRMVIDIVKFFFIYTLVLFAFACGLTQLLWYFNDLEKQKCFSLAGGLPNWAKQGDACMKWRRFHNLFEASQSLFWAGFGMVGLGDFELSGIQDYTRFWSMLMFGAYSVINIIVLLNLLIAMMSNSYAFIVDHADTEWKFARTKLWMSYFEEGSTLPPPFNILPNIKLIWKLTGRKKADQAFRRMSTRTERIKRKVRDYKYLGVMRALIWRYVCSLQARREEQPVTEDHVSEVKGDISALRYELIDLFDTNGMDTSNCEKKSRAAFGRKMRIWERRLMRDFHVSPAMGSEEHSGIHTIEEEAPKEMSAAERFRRIARLAMTSKVADISATSTGKTKASQIGSSDETGKETLKEAMAKARKKMEQDTPEGSPGSSRGCSPYPDLYTGPNLLDAIKNLDLSPIDSPAVSPIPKLEKGGGFNFQGQINSNSLMVPERKENTRKKPTQPKENNKQNILSSEDLTDKLTKQMMQSKKEDQTQMKADEPSLKVEQTKISMQGVPKPQVKLASENEVQHNKLQVTKSPQTKPEDVISKPVQQPLNQDQLKQEPLIPAKFDAIKPAETNQKKLAVTMPSKIGELPMQNKKKVPKMSQMNSTQTETKPQEIKIAPKISTRSVSVPNSNTRPSEAVAKPDCKQLEKTEEERCAPNPPIGRVPPSQEIVRPRPQGMQNNVTAQGGIMPPKPKPRTQELMDLESKVRSKVPTRVTIPPDFIPLRSETKKQSQDQVQASKQETVLDKDTKQQPPNKVEGVQRENIVPQSSVPPTISITPSTPAPETPPSTIKKPSTNILSKKEEAPIPGEMSQEPKLVLCKQLSQEQIKEEDQNGTAKIDIIQNVESKITSEDVKTDSKLVEEVPIEEKEQKHKATNETAERPSKIPMLDKGKSSSGLSKSISIDEIDITPTQDKKSGWL